LTREAVGIVAVDGQSRDSSNSLEGQVAEELKRWSLEGPMAPCSNATKLRAALITLTTAASTSGSIF